MHDHHRRPKCMVALRGQRVFSAPLVGAPDLARRLFLLSAAQIWRADFFLNSRRARSEPPTFAKIGAPDLACLSIGLLSAIKISEPDLARRARSKPPIIEKVGAPDLARRLLHFENQRATSGQAIRSAFQQSVVPIWPR